MHAAINGLLHSLSFGKRSEALREETSGSTVGRLARVYEVARNALEFRADHLVRRAAIERILRRQLLFGNKASALAEQLIQELRWAMYLTEVEERGVTSGQLEDILAKLVHPEISGKVNHDWLLGLVSAEIEERLNPNVDYHRFTTFAYHALRENIRLPYVQNLDLVVYVVIDRVYSLSDEQQISYHLYKLIRSQTPPEKQDDIANILDETWKHFHEATTSSVFNSVMAFVRRQMAPLVLLRDLYFMSPGTFSATIAEKDRFYKEAGSALGAQMMLMRKRISTATVRSLTYVFLTKMLLVLLVEVPIDRALIGYVDKFTMALNLIIPVGFMWLMTASIKLPSRMAQEKLLTKAWQIVSDFEAPPTEGEILEMSREGASPWLIVYYALYGLLFIGIFALLVTGLTWLHYTFASLIIFLFFLSIVSFFAYRIRQTAQLYSYRPKGSGSSFGDMLILPIVVVGGILSTGVSRLNFIVFIFDFVLEAPYKIILKFLDSWMAFLSKKKDEAVG